jgi:hypothetical protein
LSEVQAAAFIKAALNDAYDKWTTQVYDYIQFLQNNIVK